MLQNPRACNGSLLGYMAYNENHYPQLLCNPQEAACHLPYLAYTSGSRIHFLTIHGLYGVNNNKLGFIPLQHSLYSLKGGFRYHVKMMARQTNTVSSKFNLLDGFLSGNIKNT